MTDSTLNQKLLLQRLQEVEEKLTQQNKEIILLKTKKIKTLATFFVLIFATIYLFQIISFDKVEAQPKPILSRIKALEKNFKQLQNDITFLKQSTIRTTEEFGQLQKNYNLFAKSIENIEFGSNREGGFIKINNNEKNTLLELSCISQPKELGGGSLTIYNSNNIEIGKFHTYASGGAFILKNKNNYRMKEIRSFPEENHNVGIEVTGLEPFKTFPLK